MILKQSLAKWNSYIHQLLCGKMTICILSCLWTTKWSFKSKAIDNAIFFIAHYSCSTFFTFWNWKITIFEAKRIICLWKNEWKHFFLVFADWVRSIFVWTSKHKYIFLSRMGMAVNIKKDFSCNLSLFKHLFGQENLWNSFLAWRNPFSI